MTKMETHRYEKNYGNNGTWPVNRVIQTIRKIKQNVRFSEAVINDVHKRS